MSALFIILVGLTMTWFSEKMPISNRCRTWSKNLGRYLVPKSLYVPAPLHVDAIRGGQWVYVVNYNSSKLQMAIIVLYSLGMHTGPWNYSNLVKEMPTRKLEYHLNKRKVYNSTQNYVNKLMAWQHSLSLKNFYSENLYSTA